MTPFGRRWFSRRREPGPVGRVVIALLLLIPGLSAVPALAWQRPAELLFARADADHDGLISGAEWHALMTKRFAALDANRDGAISRQEFAAARRMWQQSTDQLFTAADSDRNGSLDGGEWQAVMTKRFAALDANHDGAVSRDELAQAKETARRVSGRETARF